jgi:hypothetical protein
MDSSHIELSSITGPVLRQAHEPERQITQPFYAVVFCVVNALANRIESPAKLVYAFQCKAG